MLAEVDFGDDPADWREGQRFESVYNRLLGDAPVSAICLYDRRRLPAAVVESAAATHPQLVRGTDLVGRAPASRTRACTCPPSRCPGPPSRTATRSSPSRTRPPWPASGTSSARCWPRSSPTATSRRTCTSAASEIAANAFRHGVRPVSARVWADGDRVICVISDRGTSYTDPFSGFTPAHGLDLSHGGMGLWLARKLWDHVDVLPTDDGPVGPAEHPAALTRSATRSLTRQISHC